MEDAPPLAAWIMPAGLSFPASNRNRICTNRRRTWGMGSTTRQRSDSRAASCWWVGHQKKTSTRWRTKTFSWWNCRITASYTLNNNKSPSTRHQSSYICHIASKLSFSQNLRLYQRGNKDANFANLTNKRMKKSFSLSRMKTNWRRRATCPAPSSSFQLWRISIRRRWHLQRRGQQGAIHLWWRHRRCQAQKVARL